MKRNSERICVCVEIFSLSWDHEHFVFNSWACTEPNTHWTATQKLVLHQLYPQDGDRTIWQSLVKGQEKKRLQERCFTKEVTRGTRKDPGLHDSSLIENVEKVSFKVILADMQNQTGKVFTFWKKNKLINWNLWFLQEKKKYFGKK